MKIIQILSFILIAIVILALVSIFITDIKGCSETKPEEETTISETKETTLKEQTTQEPTEGTEKTSEVLTEETTTSITTEETSEEEGIGHINFSEAKHQGYVEDIDYENKIIKIKNEITGEIEKLDDFSYYLSVGQSGSRKSKGFEDIKVRYYIFAMTEKEVHFDIFYEPTDKIKVILFSEEKPKWAE